MGDYKVFTKEIVANLFDCLPKGNYPYDFQLMNSRKNLEINTITSNSMQITMQYISKKSTKDDFSAEFSFLKALYHEYCLILTGICSFYMDFKNTRNNSPKFKSPLPCLITYQGKRVLILTKNQFYMLEEHKIHGFSEETQQKQRISAKFLEDFKIITSLLRLDAQQTYMSLSLSQELIVFHRDSCYYILNPQGISPKDALSSKKPFDYQEKVLEILINLQEIPLAEHHFSDLLHKNGLKVCQTGFLLSSTIVNKTPYLKNLLILEIISRCCKQMLRNLLLQSDSQEELPGLSLDFLNLVIGNEEDSDEFWRELLPSNIFKHFAIDFKENIDKKAVDQRILIKKIIAQCGLRISLDPEDENSEELLKSEDFQGFSMKIQGFSLKHTSFLSYLHAQASLLDNKSPETLENCFQANLSLYSLYKSIEDFPRTVDFGLNLCELYHKTLNYSQEKASIMKLFDYFKGQPALEIKGNYLLFRNKLETEPEKSLEFFVILLKKLEDFQGPFHPLHIFCYKDLALYYKEKGRAQDCVFLLKNAIICASKLFYQEHEIIADLYVQLAEAYILLKTYEDALFYLQKTWEIKKIQGVGLKIAKVLLTMNRILEAKELFLMLLERNDEEKSEENSRNPLEKLEIMINLAHICLILNEKAEAEQFLRDSLQFYGDLPLNYEKNVISLVFFLTIRRLSQSQRRLIWVISRSLQDYGVGNYKNFIEYTKKFWNLLDFMKTFFDELVFICEKHEYNNDSEYWRLYLKNIEITDPHNLRQSLECLHSLMKIVGNEVFLEELMR